MAKKQQKTAETDYLFASARVRAAEARLIGADKLESAISSKDKGEIEALAGSLCEGKGDGALGAYLTSVYDFISEISPSSDLAAVLRYPYDCNNIKSAIKCHFRGIASDGMMCDSGTVAPAEITRMVEKRDFSSLPENMARGAEEAFTLYARSLNPQIIDMVLDKACYADMLDGARRSGDDFTEALVKLKIDLTNFMMTLRCLRMSDAAKLEGDILASSLIEGGSIPAKALLDAYFKDEATLSSLLSGGELMSLSLLLSKGKEASISEIEKECDDIYMRKVRSAKFLPFGAPLLISYGVAAEYTVKNLRIILAGKRQGLRGDEIRKRVRLSYV